MMRRCAAIWLLTLLGVLVGSLVASVEHLHAQEVEVESGVEPREVTVGDRFRSVIRIHAPAGTRVHFPPTVADADVVEALGPVQVLGGEGAAPHTAVYDLVAWQPGRPPEPTALITLRLPGGDEHALRVAVPMPVVRSVLPADTTGVEPRGARGIVQQERGFPWWLVAAAVLLLVLAAAIAGRRVLGRGRAELFGGVSASPREQALEQLDRARRAGLIEAGAWKPFFSQISDALRGYLATLSPRWTEDLTTAELVASLHRDGLAPDEAEQVEAILRRADLVKFARFAPTPEQAEQSWRSAWEVVETLQEEPLNGARPTRSHPADGARVLQTTGSNAPEGTE